MAKPRRIFPEWILLCSRVCVDLKFFDWKLCVPDWDSIFAFCRHIFTKLAMKAKVMTYYHSFNLNSISFPTFWTSHKNSPRHLAQLELGSIVTFLPLVLIPVYLQDNLSDVSEVWKIGDVVLAEAKLWDWVIRYTCRPFANKIWSSHIQILHWCTLFCRAKILFASQI